MQQQLSPLSDMSRPYIPPSRRLVVQPGEETPAEPYYCPDCFTGVPFVEIQTDPYLASLKVGIVTFERGECLCEVRRREQEEAAVAERIRKHKAEELAVQTARNKKASGLAGVPGLLRLTFDAFDASRSPSMADAAERMRSWAEGFTVDETARGWALSSPLFGNGKTHLAVATARVLLDRGISVRVATMADLLAEIRKEFADKSGNSVGSAMDRATAVNVLVIDDFGCERIASDERGDWTREQLFTLFDRRCRYLRPVIVTTNLDLSAMESRIGGDHGGRVASRLLQLATWLDVDGPDGRALESLGAA